MLDAVERKIEQFIAELEDKDTLNLYKKLPAGKRLRARLILEIAGDSLPVVKTAAIVEMIHGASLLHDDVIDDANTRRGVASINAIYGNKTAIMLGDILYSKAFYELSNIDPKLSRIISRAVTLLSIGERQDVVLSESFNSNEELYKQMIYNKTAVLIEASAEAAAYLAGKELKPYRVYGKNLGVAFQMVDDILDITQDSTTLGKPALADYKEGKTTLPYIYLYHSLPKDEQKVLRGMHKKKLKEKESRWIAQKMQEYKVIPKAQLEAKELVKEAIEIMQNLGEVELESIATKMIERSF